MNEKEILQNETSPIRMKFVRFVDSSSVSDIHPFITKRLNKFCDKNYKITKFSSILSSFIKIVQKEENLQSINRFIHNSSLYVHQNTDKVWSHDTEKQLSTLRTGSFYRQIEHVLRFC